MKQSRHSRGLPSREGLKSAALRWIVKSSLFCRVCGGPLPESGGVVRFCSKLCRKRRHNRRAA